MGFFGCAREVLEPQAVYFYHLPTRISIRHEVCQIHLHLLLWLLFSNSFSFAALVHISPRLHFTLVIMATLPAIDTVPSLPTESRAKILDLLFEPCTQLHTLSVSLLQESRFETYSALIAAVGGQLRALFKSISTSDTEWLDAILSAHPRLGEKKVGNLSEASRAEQAKLQGGAAEEGAKLKALNEEYERTFPGLRYVYVP